MVYFVLLTFTILNYFQRTTVSSFEMTAEAKADKLQWTPEMSLDTQPKLKIQSTIPN